MVLRISRGKCQNCAKRELALGIGRRTCTSCKVTVHVCAQCAEAGKCKSCNRGELVQTEMIFPHSLFMAIRSGDVEGVRRALLGDHPRLASVLDERGRPPLCAAAELENTSVAHQICSLLLAEGADPRAQDKDGETPLMLMRSLNTFRLDTADFFRASVNDTDKHGRTALMYAAHGTGSMGQRKGHLRMARYLIEVGADPMAVDAFGKTALWWAIKYNDTGRNEEMITFLKEQMMLSVAKRLLKQNYNISFDDSGALRCDPRR